MEKYGNRLLRQGAPPVNAGNTISTTLSSQQSFSIWHHRILRGLAEYLHMLSQECQGQAVLTGSKSSFILSIGKACIGSGRAKKSCGCAGCGSGRAKQASGCSCSYRIRGPFPVCLVVFQTELLEENPALFTQGRPVSLPHSHSTQPSHR